MHKITKCIANPDSNCKFCLNFNPKQVGHFGPLIASQYSSAFGNLHTPMDLINVEDTSDDTRPVDNYGALEGFPTGSRNNLFSSDRGTIAVAKDGMFQDVDNLYTWSVEGEKATVGSTKPIGVGTRAIAGESSQSHWKQTTFQASHQSRNVSSIAYHEGGQCPGRTASALMNQLFRWGPIK